MSRVQNLVGAVCNSIMLEPQCWRSFTEVPLLAYERRCGRVSLHERLHEIEDICKPLRSPAITSSVLLRLTIEPTQMTRAGR